MKITEVQQLNIPKTTGSYQFYNKLGQVIYVGKAINLHSRVLSYWRKSSNLTPAKLRMIEEITRIDWLETETEIEALLLEANLVKKYQPYYNVDLRDDKRFTYIKIDLEAEIPTVMATRKIDKSGRYFGPFVSSMAVKETLKTIRKIWPYCTNKKITTKPCFYYQLGRCDGICGGIVSKSEYIKDVIKPIIAFLEGKKGKIIKDLEKELKKAKSLGDQLEANKIQWRIINMRQVLANSRVLEVGDKYINDVEELAKVLGLSKIPQRIEGYDLSTLFGGESVGSMVVFENGEAEKSEYRKFKIRSGAISDVEMLEEVLTRRFSNDWPQPDLMIIDGGKAQLNVANRVLKRLKQDVLVIAISKGEGLRSSIAPDKIFFPGEKKPLELPLASPVLHLVKRVRDEAHRFAIGYHRQLRRQKFWQ